MLSRQRIDMVKKLLTVRLDEKKRDALIEKAKSQGTNASVLIQNWIDKYLDGLDIELDSNLDCLDERIDKALDSERQDLERIIQARVNNAIAHALEKVYKRLEALEQSGKLKALVQ